MLTHLLAELPEGVAAPSSWLRAQGVSPQLARKYVQSGWLVALTHGAFARPIQPVDWQGVLLGLQRFADYPIHVGGISALTARGHAQYLPLGGEPSVHLWTHASDARSLPRWVKTIELQQRWEVHTERLFDKSAERVGLTGLLTRVRNWELAASAPERAILEVLSLVDETPASFTHAAELFEGLTTLRPAVAQRLLEACRSIKAKRLFVFLASRYDYAWRRKLNLAPVALGSGKRLITRGGRLAPEFSITVPEPFIAEPR